MPKVKMKRKDRIAFQHYVGDKMRKLETLTSKINLAYGLLPNSCGLDLKYSTALYVMLHVEQDVFPFMEETKEDAKWIKYFNNMEKKKEKSCQT